MSYLGNLSEQELKDWKETLAKSGIQYESDEDYIEALHNLAGFFDVLIQMDLQQEKTKDTEQF